MDICPNFRFSSKKIKPKKYILNTQKKIRSATM